jgi:hypothetical protein
VKAIIASMNMIKTLTGGGQIDSDGNPVGPLAWIPLKMMVSPKSTISPEGQPVLIYVVRLEFDGLDERLTELGYQLMRKRIEHGMNMGRLQKQAQRLLVAPHQEDELDQVETAEEFFSEAVTDLSSPHPEGPDDGSAGKTTEKETAPSQLTDGSGAPLAAVSNQSQDGEVQKPMTIPEVIEACQANTYIPVFPITLVTTKGLRIGKWVGRKMDKMELHPTHVVFEMRPDMTDATGLTKDRVAKKFDGAGYKVEFQEPGTMKKALEKVKSQEPPVQEEAVIPPVEQITPQDGGGLKSLF